VVSRGDKGRSLILWETKRSSRYTKRVEVDENTLGERGQVAGEKRGEDRKEAQKRQEAGGGVADKIF